MNTATSLTSYIPKLTDELIIVINQYQKSIKEKITLKDNKERFDTFKSLREFAYGLVDYDPSIKANNVDILCNYLSGGKQQKVVLAKWMHAGVSIMIMDHPTRGIDVGAKKEVYSVIRDLTNSGISIILVSDTIEETIGLSNNIIVLKDGELQQIVKSNKGNKPLPIEILKYMV